LHPPSHLQQHRALFLGVEELRPLLQVPDASEEPFLSGVFISKVCGVAGTMTGKCVAVAWSDAVAVDDHRGLVSCTRAPLNVPSTLRAFPSWQAYSYIGPSVRVNGTAAV